MDTSPSEWVQEYFTEIEQEIRSLAAKHNDLVRSTGLMWAEVHRTTSDPLTRQQCQNRMDEIKEMIHIIPDVNNSTEIKIPNSGKTAWD